MKQKAEPFLLFEKALAVSCRGVISEKSLFKGFVFSVKHHGIHC